MALSSVWAGDRSSCVLDVVPKQALYGSRVLLNKMPFVLFVVSINTTSNKVNTVQVYCPKYRCTVHSTTLNKVNTVHLYCGLRG